MKIKIKDLNIDSKKEFKPEYILVSKRKQNVYVTIQDGSRVNIERTIVERMEKNSRNFSMTMLSKCECGYEAKEVANYAKDIQLVKNEDGTTTKVNDSWWNDFNNFELNEHIKESHNE